MATKIKVKKITDLTLVPAENQVDIYGNTIPGVQDEDKIIVAHNTNVNNDGGAHTAVMHSNIMEMGELTKYIGEGLKDMYMSAEDGKKLEELIEQKLREAEENMAKGNDTYSSNYFVDDAGTRTFETTTDDGWEDRNSGLEKHTKPFTFKSTSSANCHFTIYNTGPAASVTAPKTATYAKIEILSRSGDWKALCQQPVQTAHGAFDVDLHGYFYAGTQIRGTVHYDNANMGTDKPKINFKTSHLQVTRFSSDKGFPEHSFDWWVSNNGALSSSWAPPDLISGVGFLKFDGLYYHGRVGTVGQKGTDYYNAKSATPWKNHYCTDAVYAKILSGSEANNYFLGNTENDRVAADKQGITDDFSGKYYYISANANCLISAYTQTDFTFTDDTKKKGGYADSGGGWHNATLIQYVDYDELSTVLDNLPEGISVHCLSDVQDAFRTGDYHTFVYEGGLAPYLTATVKSAEEVKKVTPYMGTASRNTARLELKSYDGTPGCYVSEYMGSVVAGGDRTTYSFIPTYANGQMMHTIIRDYDNGRWKLPVSDQYKPIKYRLKLLNQNVEWLAASRDIYRFNSKVIKGQKKTDDVTLTALTKHLENEVSSGWSLISVDLKPVPEGQSDITIRDFGFASCPRLSSFTFPRGVGFTGRYTFAAPPTKLKWLSCDDNVTVQAKTVVKPSKLSSVTFYCGKKPNGEISAVTHVDGIDSNGQTWATFANCVNLEHADIEHTDLQILGDHTFLSCGKLLSVDIPNTCTALGNSVFLNCKTLSSISIPASISAFGTKVFAGCPQLTAANKYNAKTNKFNYILGTDYNITIKLSGLGGDYLDSSDQSILLTNKIWSEISGLVNCLHGEKMAQTATSKTLTSRAGRRFYIVDRDGKQIGGKSYVFNTVNQNNSKVYSADCIVLEGTDADTPKC